MASEIPSSAVIAQDVKQTIVIVGSGAVGLLYGCRLLEAERISSKAGTETHFICRRDLDHCTEHGIRMKSPDGDFYSGKGQSFANRIHKDSSTIHVPSAGIDWVICAVKSYAFQDNARDSLRALITPMVGAKTRLLLIMNGLGCQQILCEWFGTRSIFVGMAFTCVNRNNPSNYVDVKSGVDDFVLVNHIAFGALHIGHCEDNAAELAIASSIWVHTKIATKVTVAPSLLHAQWSKLCWNIPFSGLCVALGGVTTDIIANDSDLRFLADKIMGDTISLANEDIRLKHIEDSLTCAHDATIPALLLLDADQVKSFCWTLTDRMGPYKPSTVLDLISGSDLELEYIFHKPLDTARRISKQRRSQLKQCVEKLNLNGEVDTSNNAEMTDWPHLETVVRQLTAIGRMAAVKRKIGMQWSPTLILDVK